MFIVGVMALLLLLAISTSLFHPTTALFTIAALLLFGITPLLYRQFAAARASGTFSTMGENMTRVALLTSLIMILFFSTWYFSTGAVQNQFGKITDWLAYEITTGSDYVPSSVAAPAGFTPDGAAPGGSTSGESTPSQGPIPSSMFQRLMYALSKADLTPSQTTELFINRYGAIFLYLIIAGILAITALGRFLFRKKTSDPMSFTYSLQFLLALAISAFMLFVYAPEADELRIVRFPLFMGTVLSGLMVYDFIASYPRENHSRARLLSRRTVLATTTGMVIITAAALSIGSVYGDYRTARQHQQVTHTEFAGIEWFQELGNHEVPIITNSPMQLWRFQHYYGVDSPGRSMPKINFAQLPSHFGYDEHVNIAEALSLQDEYIAILPPDRIAPLVRRTPGFAQWTKEDFIKLNSDPTTNKVYSNGEFEVWRVYNNQR